MTRIKEAIAFIVDRYGEYVLLKPTTSGSNLMLWLAGPIMLLIAAAVGFSFLRKRSQVQAEGEKDNLSEAEKERLRQILED